MHAIALLAGLLTSILSPSRGWFPPDAPMTINVKAQGDERLVLTRFGSNDELASKDVAGDSSPDVKTLFPQLATPGCYLLYLVPKGKPLAEFTDTPLVISVKENKGTGDGKPMVTRVEPLRYAVMTTKQGPLTMAFYYDDAPNTVASFLSLASEGYYDGLKFHRIVPNFVIQGGDPTGTGTGGPGYSVNQEFNSRPHLEGVLSMARAQDPNSAGSQFFICLDYSHTKALDNNYTVFGKVTKGLKAVKEIGAVPTNEKEQPIEPQIIEKVEVKPVTSAENPYPDLFKQSEKAQ